MQINNNQKLKLLNFLNSNRDKILLEWLNREVSSATLNKYLISSDFFIKFFGRRVLDYFISILNDENEIGDCPVIGVMIKFFESKKLPLDDIFLICINFREVILFEYLKYEKEIDFKTLDVINMIFDFNFAGVIRTYLNDMGITSSINDYSLTPKEKKEEIAKVETFQPQVRKVKFQTYESEFLEDDILELKELEDDILDVLTLFITMQISEELIENFSKDLYKYGYIVSKSELFKNIGLDIIKLSEAFGNGELYENIVQNKSKLSLVLECFINDIAKWRKSILEDGIDDPNFLNDSIKINCMQIINYIDKSENKESEDDEIEFF